MEPFLLRVKHREVIVELVVFLECLGSAPRHTTESVAKGSDQGIVTIIKRIKNWNLFVLFFDVFRRRPTDFFSFRRFATISRRSRP